MNQVEKTKAEWRAVIGRAIEDCLREGDKKTAAAMKSCTIWDDVETVEDVYKLLFKPRALEVMMPYKFPSLETMRDYKASTVPMEENGIYVDSGNVEIEASRRVLLAGETFAKIRARDRGLTEVVIMHGARAEVEAGGYAVVAVYCTSDSNYTTQKRGDAIILK